MTEDTLLILQDIYCALLTEPGVVGISIPSFLNGSCWWLVLRDLPVALYDVCRSEQKSLYVDLYAMADMACRMDGANSVDFDKSWACRQSRLGMNAERQKETTRSP